VVNPRGAEWPKSDMILCKRSQYDFRAEALMVRRISWN
jgi:hypothetical protein